MAKLKYSQEYYRASSYLVYQPLSREEMAAEYDRLAKQVNRNLERIRRSEFGDDQFYRKYYDEFQQPAAELSERELAFKLQDLAYLRQSSRGTYSGAREAQREAVRSMKDAGYKWVTYSNYQSFAEFMQMVKTSYGEHIYDSKRIVEYYEQHKQRGVSPEEVFADFVQYNGAKNL